ncbi:SpoIIE family protein phosphatase [Candidatus Latescibacterota bacterium]
MLRNKSLAFKLILFLSSACMVIFLVIFGASFLFAENLIEKNVESNAINLIQSIIYQTESVLNPVEVVPENLAFFLEQNPYDQDLLMQMLRSAVQKNDDIYGATVAFEPFSFGTNLYFFSPYYYKQNGELFFSWLGSEEYHIFSRDWYQIPKELNKPIWTEPYFDEGGGGILMATYSVPFYEIDGSEKKVKGIVTADISIEWLADIVKSLKILDTGYAFLISINGTIITHPNNDYIMNETIFSIAEASNNANLRTIGKRIYSGESGFIDYTSVYSNEDYWMNYAHIPSTGWTLAVLFPKDEYLADIRTMSFFVILFGFLGFTLIFVSVYFSCQSTIKPLRAMAKVADEIGSGNLDVELIPTRSHDEIGKLTEAFRFMKTSLKDYIEQLKQTTAAKERFESELKIAKDIQLSMLPRKFPPFPNRLEFEIFASMEAAREVGGDFYDFFFIDDHRLCFLVGDVSGKGVPAALFMVTVKTLLKFEAQHGFNQGDIFRRADGRESRERRSRLQTPGDILSRVNSIIAQENDEAMFVTLFFAIFNTQTGELSYANAGHNPPLVYTKQDSFQYISMPKGIVLGVIPEYTFTTQQIQFNASDTIFIYTDGVTEAMNFKKELFGEERLKEKLINIKDKSSPNIIGYIRDEIKSFARGEEQSDDITMLIFTFNGNENKDIAN